MTLRARRTSAGVLMVEISRWNEMVEPGPSDRGILVAKGCGMNNWVVRIGPEENCLLSPELNPRR